MDTKRYKWYEPKFISLEQMGQGDPSLNVTLSFIINHWYYYRSNTNYYRCGYSWQTVFLHRSLWPWQIGQGHQSLNFTLSFVIWISGNNIDAIQIVGVEKSSWQTCFLYQPLWRPSQIGQGHQSSNLTLSFIICGSLVLLWK